MKDKYYLLVLYYKDKEINYHCYSMKEVEKILHKKINTKYTDFDIYSHINNDDQLELLQLSLKRIL